MQRASPVGARHLLHAAMLAGVALVAAALGACARPAIDGRSGETRRIAGPAGAIAVDDGGRGGLPVVFVHSYAGSKSHWRAQLAHLRNTRRALALDLRGHGGSAAPAQHAYSSAALAGDIAAVVDALAIDRFVLVGHSLGGAAAIAYAAGHPQRVAGLVLVGAPGKVPPDQAAKISASLDADYDKVMQAYWEQLLSNARPAVREQLLRERASIGRDASLAIVKGLFAEDPVPQLARYRGATLFVVTSHNDQPHDLHRVFPDRPSRLLAGTSHWPHLDAPDAFNAALDAFLASLR